MNLILPIILLVISIGTFFTYGQPQFFGVAIPVTEDMTKSTSTISSLNVKSLNMEITNYEAALATLNEIDKKRAPQIDKYNIANKFTDRLNIVLPRTVDNVRLIIELQEILGNTDYVKGVSITKTATDAGATAIGQSSISDMYNYLSINFSLSVSYDNLLMLLQRIENNLRVTDVSSLSITGNDNGVYDVSLTVKTYWQK